MADVFYVRAVGKPIGESYTTARPADGTGGGAYDALKFAFSAFTGHELPGAARLVSRPYRLFLVDCIKDVKKEADSDNERLRLKTRRRVGRAESGPLEKRLVDSYVIACPAKSLSGPEEFVLMTGGSSELEVCGQLVLNEDMHDLLKVDAVRAVGLENAYNRRAFPVKK